MWIYIYFLLLLICLVVVICNRSMSLCYPSAMGPIQGLPYLIGSKFEFELIRDHALFLNRCITYSYRRHPPVLSDLDR